MTRNRVVRVSVRVSVYQNKNSMAAMWSIEANLCPFWFQTAYRPGLPSGWEDIPLSLGMFFMDILLALCTSYIECDRPSGNQFVSS